jgi:hypothetical protein
MALQRALGWATASDIASWSQLVASVLLMLLAVLGMPVLFD